MLKKLNCPSCGAEVVFKSSFTVFGVCGFCKSMLVRQDTDFTDFGKMVDFPDDMSPLQIGAKGIYNKEPFEIIGRVKLVWEDGFWNEWHLMFGGQKYAWLAEAQGLYMVNFKADVGVIPIPKLNQLNIGKWVKLGKDLIPFKVVDIKHAKVLGAEGELPELSDYGKLRTSVDLKNHLGGFGCIEFDEKENDSGLYIGRFNYFEDLSFSNYRKLASW